MASTCQSQLKIQSGETESCGLSQVLYLPLLKLKNNKINSIPKDG